jgi:ribA/ribD-fused uncharacterized protein
MPPKKAKEDGPPAEQPTWLKDIHDTVNDTQRSVNNINDNSIPDLEKSVDHINKTLEDIKTSVEGVRNENFALGTSVTELESQNLQLKGELFDTQQKLLYLESQMRRNNLVFHGFKERKGETWDDCEELITSFLRTDLHLYDIPIERAHRVGEFRGENFQRQIMVKFLNFKDRQKVLSAVFQSEEDFDVRVFEDYPPQILQNRKQLWPIFKCAKSTEGIKASLKLDRLFINGKVFTVDNLHDLPVSLQPENRCQKQSDTTFVFFGKHSILSNFHSMNIKIEGNTYNCNEQYFQMSKAQFFGDQQTVDKIMQETDPAKMNTLGKQVKGFKKDIWKRQAKKVLKRANEAKFLQHPNAKDTLLATGQKRLGEGSPDPVYGIGMYLSSKTALDPNKWSGDNLMGQILTEIRGTMMDD